MFPAWNPPAPRPLPYHHASLAIASFMANANHTPPPSASGFFLNLSMFPYKGIFYSHGPDYPTDIKKKNMATAKVGERQQDGTFTP
ncbi:hypothetical protein AVEN_92482-1 [Araneus ventricosus]|uniref:Uncharacterized protein n=1 Tax=Araneus ventricosus TaxID=182803 RepID=A0A4Y2AHH3_ARAVE|nr:hypothetical protein AVEN_92482-1 [Araneus ventricosus]